MNKKLCISEIMCNFAERFSEQKIELRTMNQEVKHKKYCVMGINANKKIKRRKVRINGNKNSTNNWGITAAGWNAVHKAVINAE